MLRQELTIEYPHRQQGHSGHRTVPFPYPKIIDRAIGCDIVSDLSPIIQLPGRVFEIVGFWQILLVNPPLQESGN